MTNHPLETPAKEPQFPWVVVVGGVPHVRWKNVLSLGGLTAGALFGGQWAFSYFLDVDFAWDFVLALTASVAGWLVLAVELQRQRVLHGAWRWRFGLASLLAMMLCAALFFGGLGNSLRRTRAAHAQSAQLRAELLRVLGPGGHAYVGKTGGRYLSLFVRRTDFSDADLAQILALSSQHGTRSCELNLLDLRATAVTSAGVARLADCRRLQHLDLPRVALDNDALEALLKLQRLRSLGGQFTPEQRARLRAALPDVSLGN